MVDLNKEVQHIFRSEFCRGHLFLMLTKHQFSKIPPVAPPQGSPIDCKTNSEKGKP